MNEHTDQEIVDVLFNDFPKVGEQILEFFLSISVYSASLFIELRT